MAVALMLYCVFKSRRRFAHDNDVGIKHGCLPMETWIPYKWPWALDILKRQYDALPDQRILMFQSQYFDRIGPNMTFKLFGKQGYLTADPKNVESILSTNFEDWCLGSRRPGLMPLLGEGIFTQDGRPWRHSRELLRRQFARIHRQDCRVFDAHVEDLISRLRATGGVIDLQPYFFRFTLATTTALLFGGSVSALPGEETELFENAFDYASSVSALRLRLADLQWIWKPTKFRAACAVVKQYATHFVQLALDEMTKSGEEAALRKYPFIIELYKDLQDFVLVRDQLVNVLIAGRDTTACLMSWAFFLLARHPKSLAQLCSEIDQVTEGSAELTRAKIKKMKYLRCVLNETQRLYPQLPLNVRVAAKTTVIPSGGGPDGRSPVLIPKGTGVGYSVYHMHRLRSLYGKDANEFRPERWLDQELKDIGWGFMPFHGGPRICLGKELALGEASCAILRILQAFPELRLPPGTSTVPPGEEKQTLTIVVMSAEGCKVLLD
ncbi:Cytochrome P450 E-class CYP52 [Penicillium verhagenii]|uniref:Cytochrome P450 E-class CYP52 n=1 Tax=Penicillium verhagenii TaxID=1562060 RepID=UPI002545BC96|nr:Cytochrome P450 E-class CYP52 [Penicillium verhagenii]KAJ5938395.1 Cytochrome P450 E-class CYP52 [Penicillium verhagenii]